MALLLFWLVLGDGCTDWMSGSGLCLRSFWNLLWLGLGLFFSFCKKNHFTVLFFISSRNTILWMDSVNPIYLPCVASYVSNFSTNPIHVVVVYSLLYSSCCLERICSFLEVIKCGRWRCTLGNRPSLRTLQRLSRLTIEICIIINSNASTALSKLYTNRVVCEVRPGLFHQPENSWKGTVHTSNNWRTLAYCSAFHIKLWIGSRLVYSSLLAWV